MDIQIGDKNIRVSRPGKLLFSEAKLSKADLVAYYCRIADILLPHIQGRPLPIHHDGSTGTFFPWQETSHAFPDWVRRERLATANGCINKVMVNDAATLTYLAGQAGILPRVWLSRIDRPHHPDRLIFDLDSSDDNFEQLRHTAQALRRLLEATGLKPFIMTTGSRGFHVTAPLDRGATFAAAQGFAARCAGWLAATHPDDLTVQHKPSKRGHRVYLNTTRNAYGQTTVAPYAVRTQPGAPVATPIDWDELDHTAPGSYSMSNIFQRLAQQSDPWKSIDTEARSLEAAEATLEHDIDCTLPS